MATYADQTPQFQSTKPKGRRDGYSIHTIDNPHRPTALATPMAAKRPHTTSLCSVVAFGRPSIEACPIRKPMLGRRRHPALRDSRGERCRAGSCWKADIGICQLRASLRSPRVIEHTRDRMSKDGDARHGPTTASWWDNPCDVFGPARVLYSLRNDAPASIVASAVGVTAMFAATPFLIPEIADRFGVTVGLAGAISVAQVGLFAIANVALPRLVNPTGRVLARSAAVLVGATLASAVAPTFWFLIATRGVAGFAAGAITWVIWSDAMRVPRSLSRLAAAGPATALIGSPIVAYVAGAGDRAVFVVLAVAALPSFLFRLPVEFASRPKRTVSRSRSNRVLLGALAMLTFAGASLFVFAAVAVGEVAGVSRFHASLGYSLNAGGGLLGARFARYHRRPGLWLASAGPAAALVVVGGSAGSYLAGMAWWGFAFWMGVPGVMQMLSAYSREPAERAGDAQALMALGRAMGPVMGGALADAGAYTGLALVSGTGIALAGATVVAVQEGRRRLPPREPLPSA